MTCLSRTTLGI